MKKFILSLSFVVASVITFAQGYEQMIVEEIPHTSGTLDGFTTYRFYVDMEAGYKIGGVTGDLAGDMEISTTGVWYNFDPAAGGVTKGENLFPFVVGGNPDAAFDTYVAMGAQTQNTIGQPDPTADISGAASSTSLIPDDATWNDLLNVDGSIASISGSSYGWVTLSPFSVPAPGDADNIVFVGQFTTDGDISVNFNFGIVDSNGDPIPTVLNVSYTSGVVVDNPPTIDALDASPAAVNKNDAVTITATASDDNAVTQVEFFADGLSIGTDTDGNDGWSISWTALGDGDIIISAIATDDADQMSTGGATATVNVTDANPTTVSITAPNNGDSFNLNAITFSANAVDADQPIQSVTFTANGTVIGTDSDNSDADFSISASLAVGTYNIIAEATNSDAETVASSPIQITVANAVPSVAISGPSSSVINVDSDWTATASDVDGSIDRVEFYVDGTLTSTDTDGNDGYSFIYRGLAIGTVNIEARAYDNSGDFASDDMSVSIVDDPSGAPYAVSSKVEFCSTPDVICIPIRAANNPVSGVTGYDIEMTYDASLVTPTGLVIVSEGDNALLTDRDDASYNLKVEGDTLVRITLWLNGSGASEFAGDPGDEILCVEFTRNPNFQIDDVAIFGVPLLSVSTPTSVVDYTTVPDGTYTLDAEYEFNGSLSFWADNSPVGSTAQTQATVSSASTAYSVAVDANGTFTYDFEQGGQTINIEKELDNAADVQPVISGQDAYLTSLVAIEDDNFQPTVYEIIAMDVNRDQRISAGDISQIQARTVAIQGEYVQQSTPSLDWVFIPKTTVLTDESYRISAAYPIADGIGYDKDNVPVVADDIDLPIQTFGLNNCPAVDFEDYKGILLGDVTGNWADFDLSGVAPGGLPGVKSAAEEVNEFVIKLSDATLVDNVYSVPVYVSSDKNITSYDFSFKFDNKSFNFSGATDHAKMEELANVKGDLMKVTAYNKGQFKSGKLITLHFDASKTMAANNIEVVTSMINENAVTMSINTATSVESLTAETVEVYPNPVSDFLTVKTPIDANLQVVDMTGRVILTQSVFANETVKIDVAGIVRGAYILKLNEYTTSIVIR